MVVMRRALLVLVSAATAVAMGAGPGIGAGKGGGAGDEAGAAAPEADLSHHGHTSLSGGRLTVRFESENHGPAGLTDATVRLDFSVPPTAGQALPSNCLWSGDRTVLCGTGKLRRVGRSHRTALDLKTVGSPAEVVVWVGTAWNGGASDPNPENDRHRVLTPDTGDLYAF
ncbi:hypothetical protein [Streptomyces sp. NPDC088400]|uniref:hypothetical protein n=1 Tax=Streptomyces sp. NPDC088400 TaxID=3365861 RepID=UPI00381BB5E8